MLDKGPEFTGWAIDLGRCTFLSDMMTDRQIFDSVEEALAALSQFEKDWGETAGDATLYGLVYVPWPDREAKP